jgi:hypothetical protein
MSLAGDFYNVFQGASWNDLLTPATVIPIRGQSGDPGVDADGTLLFDAATGEQVALIYQMPHNWDQTVIRFHVHWAKTTSGTGDVLWEYRWRGANNGETMATGYSAWIAATGRSTAVTGNTGKNQITIDAFPELDLSAYRGSSIIAMQLRRSGAATGDTYAADARLWSADPHLRLVGLGSETEYGGT